MGIGEFGRTLAQMGSNAYNNPGEVIGYGLNQTGKAVKDSLPSMPKLKPVDQRALPDETTQNGDTWGSRTRDSFEPSGSPARKLPKQHAYNMIAPGQSNIHGGSFELVG
jgi:hypothetical protein